MNEGHKGGLRVPLELVAKHTKQKPKQTWHKNNEDESTSTANNTKEAIKMTHETTHETTQEGTKTHTRRAQEEALIPTQERELVKVASTCFVAGAAGTAGVLLSLGIAAGVQWAVRSIFGGSPTPTE